MPCKLRDKNQSVQRLSVNILTRWLLDSDTQILLNICKVMTCCLTKPSHSLNQCLLINGEVMSCSPEGNITGPGGSWKCSRYQSHYQGRIHDLKLRWRKYKWILKFENPGGGGDDYCISIIIIFYSMLISNTIYFKIS